MIDEAEELLEPIKPLVELVYASLLGIPFPTPFELRQQILKREEVKADLFAVMNDRAQLSKEQLEHCSNLREKIDNEISQLEKECHRLTVLEPYAETSRSVVATVNRWKGTNTGKAKKEERYDVYQKLAAVVWEMESDWLKEKVAKKVREALAKDNCYKKYGFKKLPSVSSIRRNITKPT